MTDDVDAQLEALAEGRAFARVPERRVVRVTGADAVAWLHDLLTADIAGLAPGEAGRTLLLTPTGRIRADLWAMRDRDEVVLTQERGIGDEVEAMLAPYVLGSDVTLTPDEDIAVVAGPRDPAVAPAAYAPSSTGLPVDLLVPIRSIEPVLASFRAAGVAEVGREGLERWRILRGVPRIGVDLDLGTLPAASGLDAAIAFDKGCFLGQESVSKVRHLGHPPTVLRHVRCEGVLDPETSIVADGEVVGHVTGSCPDALTSVALVRVDWAHREASLWASDGRPLHDLRDSA